MDRPHLAIGFRSFTIHCICCVLCVGARYDSGGWKNMLHVSALTACVVLRAYVV